MHLSAALPTLGVALAAAPFTHALDSLPLDLHNSIIPSAATYVGSIDILSNTDESFANDLQKQWETNQNHGDDVVAPYLICDFIMGTGHSRVKRIGSLCNLPDIGDQPVQNLPERTCVEAQLFYADAKKCATKSKLIAVVPYTAWTKISHKDLTAYSGIDESARYVGIICPGDSEPINNRQSEVKNALMMDSKNSCIAAGVGGYTNTFTLTADGNSRLQLHQKDGELINYECLRALVRSLAEHPFVCKVEEDPPIVVSNNNARWIMQGNAPNKQLPFFEVGITGSGQTAQISDTGLSINSCYFYDSSGAVVKDKSGSVDGSRRKVVQYYAKSDDFDDGGHGTHCAGTILGKICTGNGCSAAGVQHDGSAPDAKIAVYDIDKKDDEGETFLYPDSADLMFGHGMDAGAMVHSASWGSGNNNYKSMEREHDKFQYENPDFLVIFSAGNEGEDLKAKPPVFNRKNTVDGIAKNNLNVCATMNDGQGLGQQYIAYFSSMGPTDDGRIKPDICAPGMSINSAKKSINRSCASESMDGTSMACPGVAGSALLLRQYFMDGFYPTGTKNSQDALTPTGYLIKAVILNSGRPLLGRDNDQQGSAMYPSIPYDESQGFGLISLVDAVYLKDKSEAKVLVWDKVELEVGGMWEETINSGSCNANHTSVTMSYFDKAGVGGCSECLINRLELTVIKSGQKLYPNGKTGPDTKNNSQRVRFDKDNDIITVQVEAINLVDASQKFALVVSGCVSVAPNRQTNIPSKSPSKNPTEIPSNGPSNRPTEIPSKGPSNGLSNRPTEIPSKGLSNSPTEIPSKGSSNGPSNRPTEIPSKGPSNGPSNRPTEIPSKGPSNDPSNSPTDIPSKDLSNSPTEIPSKGPSNDPSNRPTEIPSKVPSNGPSNRPTEITSKGPSNSLMVNLTKSKKKKKKQTIKAKKLGKIAKKRKGKFN